MLLILLIPLALLMVNKTTGTISDCGSAFPIHSLTADPPRIVGQNQTVHLEMVAHFPETVYNGTIVTSVTVNYLPVFTGSNDLCEHFDCPIEAGDQLLNKTFTFPPDIWGRINMRFQLLDQLRRPFLCMDYSIYASGTSKNESAWF